MQNYYIKLFVYGWLWWLIVGNLNSGAWSYLFFSDNVDIEQASDIYLCFVLFFCIGVLSVSALRTTKEIEVSKKFLSESIVDNSSPFFKIIVFAYPVLMLFESTIAIGYVPIFAGDNIVDVMYELNYGTLYNYKVIMVVSVFFSFYYMIFYYNKSKMRFLFFLTVFVLFCAISVFDGKRVVILASLCLISIYVSKRFGFSFIRKYSLVFSSVLFFLYVGTALMRANITFSEFFSNGFHSIFYSLGTEYRDFAWTVSYYNPGEIPGYSWVKSSIGSLINGSTLSFMGFDKVQLVHMDSARSWMDIFGIELGIRTGIISELWFEFGWWGNIVIFIFGTVASWLSKQLMLSTTISKLIFVSLIYSYLFLSIMGQSSVFFGVLTTSFYLYVLFLITNFLFKSKNSLGVM
jgi:oligosaccharide repeat unit polymerase